MEHFLYVTGLICVDTFHWRNSVGKSKFLLEFAHVLCCDLFQIVVLWFKIFTYGCYTICVI